MISGPLARRAQEFAEQGVPFVTATVVRVAAPTSVEPGNVALVHDDGTIEGFVGGVCAQHSVRLYSLQAIARAEPLLLRILPDGDEPPAEEDPEATRVLTSDEGAVTVQNPCLSGGAIEVFLEPFLPAPRMIVAGDTPIGEALRKLAPELGLEIAPAPSADDLAVVVAAHGRGELEILRAALEADVPYVALVASRRRGAAVLEQLRSDGVPAELLVRIDTPAGFDIGARTPAEIAVSILARIIEVRRRESRATVDTPARTATDPICGMTVVVDAETPSVAHEGEIVYFCCEGCKRTFEEQRAA